MKYTNDLLKTYAGASSELFDYVGLQEEYSEDIQKSAIRDNDRMRSRYDSDDSAERLAAMKVALSKTLEAENKVVETTLPIVGTFELYQTVKNASEQAKRDVGLKALTAHVEQLWKNDKSGSVDYQTLMSLKSHYSKQYPKSAAVGTMDKAAQSGYVKLNMADLMSIAGSIETQEDFDYLMKVHGYDSNTPRNIKARRFVVDLLSKRAEAEDDESDYLPVEQEEAAKKSAHSYKRKAQYTPEGLTSDGVEYPKEYSFAIIIEDDTQYITDLPEWVEGVYSGYLGDLSTGSYAGSMTPSVEVELIDIFVQPSYEFDYDDESLMANLEEFENTLKVEAESYKAFDMSFAQSNSVEVDRGTAQDEEEYQENWSSTREQAAANGMVEDVVQKVKGKAAKKSAHSYKRKAQADYSDMNESMQERKDPEGIEDPAVVEGLVEATLRNAQMEGWDQGSYEKWDQGGGYSEGETQQWIMDEDLKYAISDADVALVAHLLEQGASPAADDAEAFKAALSLGYHEIIDLFEQHGFSKADFDEAQGDPVQASDKDFVEATLRNAKASEDKDDDEDEDDDDDKEEDKDESEETE